MKAIAWEEFVKDREPDSFDPRAGWCKGALVRRGRQIYRLLDEGCYVDSGYRAVWMFDAENVANGDKTALYANLGDEIIKERA